MGKRRTMQITASQDKRYREKILGGLLRKREGAKSLWTGGNGWSSTEPLESLKEGGKKHFQAEKGVCQVELMSNVVLLGKSERGGRHHQRRQGGRRQKDAKFASSIEKESPRNSSNFISRKGKNG